MASCLHSSTLHDRSSNQSSKRDFRQGCGPPIHTLNQSPIERYCCCCCCCVVVMVRPHRTIYIPRPACLRSSPVRPVRMNQECRHRTSSFCRSIVITYTDRAINILAPGRVMYFGRVISCWRRRTNDTSHRPAGIVQSTQASLPSAATTRPSGSTTIGRRRRRLVMVSCLPSTVVALSSLWSVLLCVVVKWSVSHPIGVVGSEFTTRETPNAVVAARSFPCRLLLLLFVVAVCRRDYHLRR